MESEEAAEGRTSHNNGWSEWNGIKHLETAPPITTGLSPPIKVPPTSFVWRMYHSSILFILYVPPSIRRLAFIAMNLAPEAALQSGH